MPAPPAPVLRAFAAYTGGVPDKKRALITGVTGQDGSYLAEFLIRQGYEVHGILRRASTFNTARIDHIFQDPHERDLHFVLYHGDVTDPGRLARLLYEVQPDEIYHLAAMSHVRVSFELPSLTMMVNVNGTVNLLEAVRAAEMDCKIYNACSSEMFGRTPDNPLHEDSPIRPASPYGVSKAAAFHVGQLYRDGYGLRVWNGILFNHESPRRGETFVTRKITRGLAHIAAGREDKIYLGNLDAWRDWGYAPEYVEAMWRMLQTDTPADYVIATGESHSVRDFLETAFGLLDRDWRDYVVHDDRYERPVEVSYLRGDASKARAAFGWAPQTPFVDLVRIMLEADLAAHGLTLAAARARLA